MRALQRTFENHHLARESTAVCHIRKWLGEIEELVQKTVDPLELIPSEEAVYVLVGTPPDRFDVIWFANGEKHSLKALVEWRHLSSVGTWLVSRRLRSSYLEHREEERFQVVIAGRLVTVTHSKPLASALRRTILELSL